MESDYGGIRIQCEIENDIEIRHLISLRRNYHNLTEGGIKVHLARNATNYENAMIHTSPICRKILKGIVSLGRHLYKKNAATLKKTYPTLIGKTYGLKYGSKIPALRFTVTHKRLVIKTISISNPLIRPTHKTNYTAIHLYSIFLKNH